MEGEKGETRDEKAASAVAVAQAASRQQQPRHDECVGIDDPLQLRGVGVELPRQCGKRDIDDRGVDAGDEHAETDHRQSGYRMITQQRKAKVSSHRRDSKVNRLITQVIRHERRLSLVKWGYANAE